jgi:hypothetical protein
MNIESIYEILADDMPACEAVLSPASAELRAAETACDATRLPWQVASWTACTDACSASAKLWGADCLAQWYSVNANLWGRVGAALAGGEALPAADVSKVQAYRDLLLELYPTRYPALDVAAQLEEKNVGLGATLGWHEKGYFEPFLAACGPEADASKAAAASAPAAVPVAAVASGGAPAGAAGAAAAALLALLAA